jgi:hypothetical protein
MLLIAQVPLADARPFVNGDVRRLERPRFDLRFEPREKPKKPDFLRSFGALEQRRPGLPRDWPSEDRYCRAGRAIQIDTAALERLKGPARGPGQFVPSMRRLLSDSNAVGRTELWLTRVPRRPLRRPMSDHQVEALLAAFATMPVGCRSGKHITKSTVLAMGPLLAAQALTSTTQRFKPPDGFATQDWWVTAGRPLLMLQYAEEEVLALPPQAIAVPVESKHMTLHYMTVADEGTWLIGVGPRANTARLRELRLHLMRLHCEDEVAGILVEHFAGRRIAASEDLQRYLKRSLKLIKRTKFYGRPPSATLKVAYEYAEQVVAGPRVTLEQSLKKALRECRKQRKAAATEIDDALFPL